MLPFEAVKRNSDARRKSHTLTQKKKKKLKSLSLHWRPSPKHTEKSIAETTRAFLRVSRKLVMALSEGTYKVKFKHRISNFVPVIKEVFMSKLNDNEDAPGAETALAMYIGSIWKIITLKLHLSCQ